MSSLPPLYLIADRATCGGRDLKDILNRALNAGVRFIQLREKTLSPDALRRLARPLLSLTNACGAHLILNTHADAAAELGARGVHLPAHGPSPEAVRRQFGNRLLIGCSAHNAQELDRAEKGGADFVTYSPIYPSPSKPARGPAVGLSGLRAAVSSTRLPVFALSGITPERAAACKAAGAAGIAVMSGILAADDVESAVRAYLGAWESA